MALNFSLPNYCLPSPELLWHSLKAFFTFVFFCLQIPNTVSSIYSMDSLNVWEIEGLRPIIPSSPFPQDPLMLVSFLDQWVMGFSDVLTAGVKIREIT